jgi:hypothetical protein
MVDAVQASLSDQLTLHLNGKRDSILRRICSLLLERCLPVGEGREYDRRRIGQGGNLQVLQQSPQRREVRPLNRPDY